MECKIMANKAGCTCSYSGCERHGLCCECVAYHKRLKEVPGCLFPRDVEKTYDRTIKTFVKAHSRHI